MRQKIFTLFATLLLAGCASYVNPNNVAEVSKGVTVTTDNYKKVTNYVGPVMRQTHKYGLTPNQGFITLQASKQFTTGKVIYIIHVRDQHFQTTWRYLDTAYDSHGNRLETIKGNSNVDCMSKVCLYEEGLLIVISRNYLEQNKEAGIKFQVSGRNGSEQYEVPSAYIKAFLDKVPF